MINTRNLAISLLCLTKKVTEDRIYINYLANVNNTENFKKGLDKVIAFRNRMTDNPTFIAEINQQFQTLRTKKQAAKASTNAAAVEDQINYLEKKLK